MNTRKRIKTIMLLCALFCACMILAISFYSKSVRDVYAYVADKESSYSWEKSGMTVTTDSTVYYEGEKSLKIVDETIAGESYAELTSDHRFKVSSGAVYETSVWFCSKECSADATFKLHLYLYENNGGTPKKLTGTTYALNAGKTLSQWQKAVTRLEIPSLSNGDYYAAYYIETSGGYANVWLDSFSCIIVEDENDVIVEYDDFSAFSSEQQANLGNYAKTQQIGEWQLESEKKPSDSTACISRYGNYTAVAGNSQKNNALCLKAYKDQGYAYVTKKITTLFDGDVYTLTGHYKTSDNAIYTYAGIKFYDYAGNEISGYEKSVKLDYSGTSDTSADEKEFSVKFTAPSNLYAKIFLGTTGYGGNNDAFVFYFRDVKISLVKKANMLSDLSGMYFDAIEYEIQNEDAVKGYALKAVLDYNGSSSRLSYVTIPGNGVKLYKDKQYVLSYYAKVTEIADGFFGAMVYFSDGNNTGIPGVQGSADSEGSSKISSVSNDWQYKELKFSVSQNVTLDRIMLRNLGGKNQLTVYIDEVSLTVAEDDSTVNNEWNKAVNATSIDFENSMAICGESFSFDMSFSLTSSVRKSFTPRAEIIDDNGKKITTVVLECSKSTSDWSLGEVNDCSFSFTVPYWLPSGNYALRFDDEQINLSYGSKTDNVILEFSVGSSAVTETVAKVEKINGEPILKINEKATAPAMFSYPSSDYAFLADIDDKLYSSGTDLFVTFEGNLAGNAKNQNPIWQEDGTLDYDAFDKQVERALSNGNGYAMINIGIYAPNWWTEGNPNECALTSDGKTKTGSPALKQASFSSVKFREEAGEQVRLLIEHMKKSQYYKRIFGIKLSSGRTGEWMNYGDVYFNDVSPVALVAFKKWAKDRYNTVSALNAAWKTAYSDFSDIVFPELAKTSDFGIALNPETQRNVIDYYLFLSDVIAEDFIYYAQIVKSATENKKIVGGYFGYSWFSASYGGIGTEHLSLEKVLSSSDVDFVASPISYSMRLLGRSSQFMTAQDTVRAYGKLYLLEQDNRTAAIRNYSGAWDAGTDFGIGRTHTIEDSVYELKRDFANDFINGNAYWYYDMFGGWFDDSQIYAFMKDAKQEYDYSLMLDSVTDNAEVAVFISNSLYSYGVDSSDNTTYAVYNSLIRTQKDNLSAMGAPYDVYKTESLVNGKVKAHKVNIILSAFELTGEERTAITEQLKKDGQYVVFIYACGLSDGETANANKMSELTGFKIGYSTDNNCNLETQITADSGIAEGLCGVRYGNVSYREIIRPYVTDAEYYENLGNYNGTRYCSLAKRNMGTWTSIFSGGVNLPAALLRNILIEAGVHVYSDSDNDIIYANSSYVALHSGVSENKTIKLDGNYAVYDVFEKKYISRDTNTIEYYHVAKDTKIFRLTEPLKFTVTKIIDGVSTTEKISSTTYVLSEEKIKNRVFLGWLYNGELYFSGSEIQLTQDVSITAVTIDFYVADGADLRLDKDYPGIRFHSFISENDKAYLQSISDDTVAFGSRIVCADMEGYLDVVTATDKWFDKNGYSEFRTVLTGFLKDSDRFFNYRFAAQGYFTVTLRGQKKTFYTSLSKNKIIAEMALDGYLDRSAIQTDEYYYYVSEEHLGSTYSGYSKYDAETLKTLYFFAKHAKPDYFVNIGDLSKWK